MNDGMRSREGLSLGLFPSNKAVYSGHFHKPHTMAMSKSSLRYLGSPYQTSLSEAGQEKYLYCMATSSAGVGAESTAREWVEEERSGALKKKNFFFLHIH